MESVVGVPTGAQEQTPNLPRIHNPDLGILAQHLCCAEDVVEQWVDRVEPCSEIQRSSASSIGRWASGKISTVIDTSANAASPSCSLRTNLRDRLLDRNPLARFGIAHPVIVRRVDARQKGVGDLSSDRFVESKELLQELRRNGHD